jgi:hypothetical protein
LCCFATGPGGDRIDASRAAGGSYDLGPGPDQFVGADDAGDFVVADNASVIDSDADVISTGDYDDTVLSDGADVVDLGPSIDRLILRGELSSGGSFMGGGSADRFVLQVRHRTEPHAWTVNSRSGRVTRDGISVASFHGFNQFEVSGRGSIGFVGSAASESFQLEAPWRARHVSIEARMGGGNDDVYFRGGAPGARFDGGAGTDRFWYYREWSRLAILFNLASGVLRDTSADGTTNREALRFENTKVSTAGAEAGPITIKGTSGPNHLKAVTGIPPWNAVVQIYGRGGDDSIYGSRGDDLLVGGAGHDVAAGKSGTDRCDAEIRLSCEK